MTSHIRDRIMKVDEIDRLEYAIGLLETLTGFAETELLANLRARYDLTPQCARLVMALHAAGGRVVEKWALLDVVAHGGAESVELKLVDVLVCHVRKTGIEIETVWGVGYRLITEIKHLGAFEPALQSPPVPAMIEPSSKARNGEPWTKEDEVELRRMKENGSDWEHVAYELERSVKACIDRWHRMRKEVL